MISLERNTCDTDTFAWSLFSFTSSADATCQDPATAAKAAAKANAATKKWNGLRMVISSVYKEKLAAAPQMTRRLISRQSGLSPLTRALLDRPAPVAYVDRWRSVA